MPSLNEAIRELASREARANTITAVPCSDTPDGPAIRVDLNDRDGFNSYALLTEDNARTLRDQLNDCLTGRVARAMRDRWGIAA